MHLLCLNLTSFLAVVVQDTFVCQYQLIILHALIEPGTVLSSTGKMFKWFLGVDSDTKAFATDVLQFPSHDANTIWCTHLDVLL